MSRYETHADRRACFPSEGAHGHRKQHLHRELLTASCPLCQRWRGIIFTSAWAEASHSRLTVGLSANHENRSHMFPRLFHRVWFDHSISNLFHQHLQSDLWLHPKSQIVPVCAAPTQRAQVKWGLLNLEHPGSYPSWLSPCCMARYRPDTGQIQGSQPH